MAFLGDHDEAHRAIDAVRSRAGSSVNTVPMADSPLNHPDWMLDHWQKHVEIGRDTGIPVPDLTGYDLRNEEQFYTWMREIHAPLHERINEFYGIRS